MPGLYVHVPFCLAKCRYCDFASHPARPGEVGPYLEALRREILGAARPGSRAESVYLGGGTPSLLEPEQVAAVLDALRASFAVAADAEVTIEANPGTLTPGKAARLRAAGVNRVSLGVQSFEDALLRRIGRAHTAVEAGRAFHDLRRAGFGNVGLDLIHGLPGQSPAAWRRDLGRALDLGPEHLSLYALSVEEGTAFAAERDRGELRLPGEDEQLEMIADGTALARAAGYERYEISNWARPGFRSRHNGACWALEEYRGFGAAAHSFELDPAPARFANVAASDEYVRRVLAGQSPEGARERLSPRQLAGEALMLGLRTLDGVALEGYAAAHGGAPAALFPEAFAEAATRGWTEEADGRLRLTEQGLLFSNAIFRQLF